MPFGEVILSKKLPKTLNKKSGQREMDWKGNYAHIHANHYNKLKTKQGGTYQF